MNLRYAWQTRHDGITHGPRLSDDPRYAAMRMGQAVHPDAVEFGPVTYIRAQTADLIVERNLEALPVG